MVFCGQGVTIEIILTPYSEKIDDSIHLERHRCHCANAMSCRRRIVGDKSGLLLRNVLADNETFHHRIIPSSITMMHKYWRSAAQVLVASLALVSLTVVCYQLHLNLTTAALLFVIVVVLISRAGSLFLSIVSAIIATLCLLHLAPPALSFRVDDPLDDVAIAAFLITSLVIARLMNKVRSQAQEALSTVSYRVIEAEEQERQRIAKDLHEGIGQRLTLLVIEIERLATDSPDLTVDVASRMDAVRQETLQVLNDVKVLAHELYSPRLEYLGIAAVMRSFCKDLGEQKGIEIDFRADGLPGLVPPDISLCLFRVLQEALHNAVKHSGVKHLNVRLKAVSDEIHLTVNDNGLGFDLEAAREARGLGLNRMQERLKLVKGTLSVDSQDKRGTTIQARIPFTSEPASKRATA
jgi:signal transduction histidine kinase